MKNRLALFALIAGLILLTFAPAINPQEAEFFGKCSNEQVAKLHKSGFTDQEIRELCQGQSAPQNSAEINQLKDELKNLKSEFFTLKQEFDSVSVLVKELISEREERIKAAEQQAKFEWWQAEQEKKKKEEQLKK